MADIINLRRARKTRRRAENERVAEINRAAFGRSRGERDAAAAESERADRQFDAHRLDPAANTGPRPRSERD